MKMDIGMKIIMNILGFQNKVEILFPKKERRESLLNEKHSM